MAHKRQAKGANKRRTAAKQQVRVLNRQAQDKYNSLLDRLKEASQSLVDATAVLLLAPKIFNVKPLIADGQVDPSKLRAQDLLVHGKEIVANYDTLVEESKTIRSDANTFIDEVASKVNVANTRPEQLFEINSTLLMIHQRCEQWLLDFNNRIHVPLVEAMGILNEALTGNKVDLSSAEAVTSALKVLTDEEKVVA